MDANLISFSLSLLGSQLQGGDGPSGKICLSEFRE